ncbi:MAG: Rieske 2Fe-2S domain-containing protein [Ilumatobacteraceae bacterium]
MKIKQFAAAIERYERLDTVAEPVGSAVKKLIPRGSLKDVLSGTWLGHQLHPLLTDIPIGSFTATSLLDLIGGRSAQPAANLLAAVGVASAVPTAAAGFADWSDTYGPARRVGVVHAAANIIGVGFYAASMVARHRGSRVSATALGLAGMGVMTVGGYLGGHLTLVRGIGVNRTLMEDPPPDWTAVVGKDELGERTPRLVELGDVPVVLYLDGATTYALSNRCTHAGGPLNEGEFDPSAKSGACVTCPWHQSVFRLEDGAVVHGPAAVPEPSYECRVSGGQVEVRPR